VQPRVRIGRKIADMPKPVRYRPADVLRWLELGNQTLRQSPLKPAGPDVTKALFEIVGKVVREGKGAIAGIAKKNLEGLEFLLEEDHLIAGGRQIPYKDVRAIEAEKGGVYQISAGSSSFAIKPYAWLEIAGHKVPIGWLRDGMEVPFELLPEEIAARSALEIKR